MGIDPLLYPCWGLYSIPTPFPSSLLEGSGAVGIPFLDLSCRPVSTGPRVASAGKAPVSSAPLVWAAGLHRHWDNGRRHKPALIGEGELGDTRTLIEEQLHREVCRWANA